jgi:selenocysteine-specific elongation factor
MSDPLHLILGTAGHIDHGKTSLVRRLTGVDTDRLPEEKRRGITIDLGFANLSLPGVEFGIVDVPGHEKFVHNMVAGATGVDLAMLVVAADDSVMPQTREHLAILHLLGLRAGLVVLTKIDLVSGDDVAFAEEELKETLVGTFLADAPIVKVSNQTGEGFDGLRATLVELAASYQRPETRRVFRLPIDRVFAIEGHGAVVTGTVLGGSVGVGDSVQLAPANIDVRIRRLQSHNNDLDRVSAGQRAAVNLAGVKVGDLERGDELAAPGYLKPSRRLLVELETLPGSRRVKDRQLLRLHMGTRETTVRLILKGASLEPDSKLVAELRSAESILADYGQRFILRLLSPVETIGGGRVLDPAVPPFRRIRDLQEAGRRIGAADPTERFDAWLEEQDSDDLVPMELACRLGIAPEEQPALMDRLLKDKRLVRLPRERLIHRVRRERLGERIVARCEREIQRRQPSRSLERSVLLQSCRRLATSATLESLIDDLVQREKLVRVGDKLGLPGRSASLTKNQQKTLDAVLKAVREHAASPPLLSELSKTLESPIKEIENLVKVAEEDGKLIRVADGVYYDPAALERLAEKVKQRLSNGRTATVAELRDLWGVSRKHAVPLCEYFDSTGLTQRNGDVRVLGSSSPFPPPK